jgi:hypothetical protein
MQSGKGDRESHQDCETSFEEESRLDCFVLWGGCNFFGTVRSSFTIHSLRLRVALGKISKNRSSLQARKAGGKHKCRLLSKCIRPAGLTRKRKSGAEERPMPGPVVPKSF